MSWIDISIIALVVLCGLIGVLRGFKKSLLSMGVFLVSFLLAFFLANVIAEAMLGIDGIKGFVLGDGKFGEGASFSLANWIYGSIGESEALLVPDSFLAKNFYEPVLNIISTAKMEIDPLQGVSLYYAFMLFSAMCGVVIFLIVRFLMVIVTTIVKSYIGKRKSALSRLFGFIVGFVHGGLWAFVITLIFSCMGGFTFVPAFAKIEGEYEHGNAVFCQHVNAGAYYIRNSLFLPSADMYGRIVNLVIVPETKDPDIDNLSGSRLELYIDVNNLNYDNSPWSIDQTTKKGVFDEANAQARTAAEFESVGFDRAFQAILDYNTRIAAVIDDDTKLTDISETQFDAYKNLVSNGTNSSVEALMNSIVAQLRGYKADYVASGRPNDESGIDWTAKLRSDYNDIVSTINSYAERFRVIGTATGVEFDISGLIPDCKTPPTGGETGDPETPPTGGETGDPETPPTGGETGDPENPPAGGETGDPETPPTEE